MIQVDIGYPEIIIVHGIEFPGDRLLLHVRLDILDNTLRGIVLEADSCDDRLVEHLVELTPKLVEFFHFEHYPCADQVHSVNHQVQFILQHFSLRFIRLPTYNVGFLLDDSEEVTEKFIEERGVLIVVNGFHTIITVVIKSSLQIYFDLLVNARDKR